MKTRQERNFEDKPAVRSRVPLLLGLSGPAGSGKTYSALRLATGIQQVFGGDIYGVDTETGRMSHYADYFKFRVVDFEPPYNPMSYWDAINHCYKKGGRTIVVDTASYMHDGIGGMLLKQKEIAETMAEKWKKSPDSCSQAAWASVKEEFKLFINLVRTLPINVIWCFRAKDKTELDDKGKPQKVGFQPIIGDDFLYEMTANALLYPQSKGVPTWISSEMGEKKVIKVPKQFEGLFKEPKQLDESIGKALGVWAYGSDYGKPTETKPENTEPVKQTNIQTSDPELDKIANEGFGEDFSLSSEQPTKLTNREELLRVMKHYQKERLIPQENSDRGDALILWLESDKEAEKNTVKWPSAMNYLAKIESKIPADFIEPHFSF